MSFEAFVRAIASPDLERVARHWHEVRGARQLPGWDDIRPSRIVAQLPNIWAYRYDRAADAFIGRLAGDRIERIFEKSLRGTPMVDMYPPADYPRLFARSKRVMCEPALFRGDGLVFNHLGRFGMGERIIMPLADDSVTGDGIFGATVYIPVRDATVEGDRENETWFAL
jgi:hypothetical protein